MPSRVAAPPPMPPGLESWARSLDLSRVNDALALEVRQFLARNQQLAPWARQEMGDRLLGEMVARIGPPPPGVPPGVYFAAVLAERRRRDMERFNATAPSAPQAPPPTTAPAYDAPPPPPPPGPFAPPR